MGSLARKPKRRPWKRRRNVVLGASAAVAGLSMPAVVPAALSAHGHVAFKTRRGSLTMATPAMSSAASSGVSAWGENELGELGDGSEVESGWPVAVSGLSGATAVAGGQHHSLALLEGGTVMAWGGNARGELGDGTSTGPETCSRFQTPCSKLPIAVSSLSGVTAIAAGSRHSLALMSNGTVMAWGDNERGQLGDGKSGAEQEYNDVPVGVSGLSGVTAIAAGGGHSVALLSNGTVDAWGSNVGGELGDGKSFVEQEYSDVPVPVCAPGQSSCTSSEHELTEVAAIAAGSEDSLALLSNGTVAAWGYNFYGQLGDGKSRAKKEYSDVPVQVTGLTGVTAIATGFEHSLALLSGGAVMTWGLNSGGALGDGKSEAEQEYSEVPVRVCAVGEAAPCTATLSGVTKLAAGRGHSLALRSGGTIAAWGNNVDGELGNGSTASSDVPVAVSGVSGATAVGAGGDFSLAISPPPLPYPRVEEVQPKYGPPAGGTSVTITGANLSGATEVRFGSSRASFEVVSEREIEATSPPGTGTVDVVVTTDGGELESFKTAADRFTYSAVPEVTYVEPDIGRSSGGASVRITGEHFGGATAVKFGSVEAESFKVESENTITAVAPPYNGGENDMVRVSVTTPGGTSKTYQNGIEEHEDEFYYGPAVTSVEPSGGPAAGGTSVTIKGVRFDETIPCPYPSECIVVHPVRKVMFGSKEATSFTREGNVITAVAPAGVGTVDVSVETFTTSPSIPADHFNYGVSTPIGAAALGGTPSHIAVTPEGDIWVSEWTQNVLKELNAKGEPIRQVRTLESPCKGPIEGPYGIAINQSGDLWITDSAQDRILELSPEGKCLREVGSEGYGNGQFEYPTGIAVAPNGDVWVTDTGNERVQELAETGEYIRQFGTLGSGPGQFVAPIGIAVDSAGNVWVAGFAAGGVQELTENGEYIRQVSTGFPDAVTVDQHNDVFISQLDYVHGGQYDQSVSELNENGAFLARFGSLGSGEGQFIRPFGLAVDSAGNLWVADTGDERIEEWSLAQQQDRYPPAFAGLQVAHSCFVGIGIPEPSPVWLSWEAASDDMTPSSEIVYKIYQATTPGGEDFSEPTYTTAPGATSFETPVLPFSKTTTFYFVVRAEDKAGVEDLNTVEKQAENICE
jgi:alpha-tubulin suppressor-like RCC1 family protein/sugar lactone lactonase YvrE